MPDQRTSHLIGEFNINLLMHVLKLIIFTIKQRLSQMLDKQIQRYLPLLGTEEKKSLISVIKSFLSLRSETTVRLTIDRYNKELEEAEAEYENGDYVTNDEMKKMVRNGN